MSSKFNELAQRPKVAPPRESKSVCEPPTLDFMLLDHEGDAIHSDIIYEASLPPGELGSNEKFLIWNNAVTWTFQDWPNRDERYRFLGRWNNRCPQEISFEGTPATIRKNVTKFIKDNGHKFPAERNAQLSDYIKQQLNAVGADIKERLLRFCITRDINGPAEYYAHRSSCWWGGDTYQKSRCVLKALGGGALLFYGKDKDGKNVNATPHARSLFVPLNDECKVDPSGRNVLVFNGYFNPFDPSKGCTNAAEYQANALAMALGFKSREFWVYGMDYASMNSGQCYLVAPETVEIPKNASSEKQSYRIAFDTTKRPCKCSAWPRGY